MIARFVQIQWTAPSLEEARRVATLLVKEKLVACANLIPHVESIYLWKGELEQCHEVKVFLKTRGDLFPQVQEHIKNNCSYEVPEISQIAFDDGNPAYFDWVASSTRSV